MIEVGLVILSIRVVVGSLWLIRQTLKEIKEEKLKSSADKETEK